MKQHEFRERFSKQSFIIQNALRGKKMELYAVGKNLGLFFEGVVSALQLLHLLLGSVVLRHIGTLCGNGLQGTAVTQYFFIEKLE